MGRRHVLIGGGPASVAAASAIRRVDESAEITMVVADPHGSYSRPGLAYYLSGELPRDRLHPFTPKDFSRLGVSVVDDSVTAVHAADHNVTLARGQALPYDRLLIATGSQAVPAQAPGAELDGVVKLDHMDDAVGIVARCRRRPKAVVVGGGITALEIVEGLRARGVHVHYFMRQERYWRNVLSEAESQLVEQSLSGEGVEIHHFTDLARIAGRDGRVTSVETGDGETIPCDIVAVATGVRPRIELARAAGLACERGILVDDHLRTSDADIYAAGDVAETLDHATGRRTMEVLWYSAVAKGRVAGANMAAGPTQTYEKDVSLNVTRLAGRKTTIIGTVGNGEDKDLEGLARGDSQSWSELGPATLVEEQRGSVRVRLELGERAILGALIMGDQALSLPLQDLVRSGADVRSIAASLREREGSLADVVNAFWQDWTARHA